MGKIRFLFFALPLLGASTVTAQELAVGVETGVTFSHLAATPDAFRGSRVGYMVGASATLSLTSWVALQAGVRIEEKGAVIPDTFELRLRYLEFPVLVRLRIGGAAWPVRPLLMFGLEPATELSCALRYRSQVEGYPLGPWQSDNCVDDRTDLWDRGVIAGGGLEIRLGGVRAAMSAQSTIGTHNIASAYGCCSLENRATTIVFSIAVPLLGPRPPNPRQQRTGAAPSRPTDARGVD